MKKFEDDEVFAKFINYMQKALYHRKLNYIRDCKQVNENEINFDDLNKDIVLNNHNQFMLEMTHSLNSKELKVLRLHFEDQLTYKEIAVLMKIQPESVRKIKYRAIKKLRSERKNESKN